MSTRSDRSFSMEEEVYYAPEWASHIIWYQIFPERFNNGDPLNDPTSARIGVSDDWEISSWTGDWYQRADWEIKLGSHFRDGVFYRRYGGDLQGVMDKLDYLKELGIGGIYLNPVFDAVSLHKYDTSYYHHVDRFFGPDPEGDASIMKEENPADPSTWQWTSADKLFLKLISEVHKRDMKIIIDGVFNHTGRDFWAFRDVIKHQRMSPYKDWYNIISFGDSDGEEPVGFRYHSWWGVKDLPVFKQENGTLVAPVREHIAAITRRWMDPAGDGNISTGIDGWRLDVPEEISLSFWQEWSSYVRSINPAAYLVGEVWTDYAVNYLNRGIFTAVMNYRFAETVQDYMIDLTLSATDFVRKLREIRESCPEQANYVLQNLMDSHDTPRLASMIVNPGREYDKEGTPEEGFTVRKPTSREREVQKLIALFQYTYIGAPMIFYGTEAGMWGADDPDDRKPMVWPDMNFEQETEHPLGIKRPEDSNDFDGQLFGWYKRLGEIRNEHLVFQTGKFQLIDAYAEKNVIVFARFLTRHNPAIVVTNRSESAQSITVSLSHFQSQKSTFIDLVSGKSFKISDSELTVNVGPVSGLILIQTR